MGSSSAKPHGAPAAGAGKAKPPLATRARFRVALSFALLVLGVVALGSFAYRTALHRSAEAEVNTLARSVHNRLVVAEREWSDTVTRRARDLARVMAAGDSAITWDRVSGRLADDPPAPGLRHVFALSASGETLFHHGPEDGTEGVLSPANAPAWLYVPSRHALFREYAFEASWKGQPVILLFLRAVDAPVLDGEGGEGGSVALAWQEQVVARSPDRATEASLTTGGGWVERRVEWMHADGGSPVLIVRRVPQALFTPGELLIGLAGSVLALLGLLHLGLGAWVLVVARRLSSLGAFAQEPPERRLGPPVTRAVSPLPAGADEIDAIRSALRGWRDAVAQRDAERTAHERLRRETDERAREARAALAESEERFRLLFNSTGDAAFVYVLSPDAGHEPGFIEVNEVACRVLGYTRDELLRMGPADVEWGGTSDQRDEAIAEIREKGEARFERVHVSKDGRRIPVEISAHLFELRGQRAVLAVARDVSERKQAEAEYRTIAQTSVDGFWVASIADGRLLDVNPAYVRMSGYSRDELLGMRVADLEACESPGEAAQHLRDIVEGRRERFETRHRRRDGSEFDVEVSAKYLPGRGGVLLAFIRDTHERKQAERRMAELLEFNRTIIAQSTLGILVFKASGGCVLANEAAATVVGESTETLLGQDFRQVRAWQGSGLAAGAEAALATGVTQRVEVRTTTGSGRQAWLECDVVPFASGGEPHLLLTTSDVTAERAAEHALREATRLAEAASLAKTEFLANMSHEIRTPMNAIIGLTHLVLDTDLSARQHDYLHKIQAASKALLGILNAILDYSKIEAGRLEVESIPFSIEQVVQVVADLFSARADEKGLSLAFEVAPGLPSRLVGDPLRLGQVLTNLVGNGLKFTERGGVRVTVSMAEAGGDSAILRFSVADTGIGLSADEGGRLFQAFTQADSSITRRYGGAGLGLAISKRLVEMMEGEIGFESQPGQGSVFRFTARVRVAAAAETSPAPDERGVDERVPAGARVLLAEDNEINLMVAKVFLENAGLVVRAARDGREAYAIAEAEPFDVILMDLQMPVMDGLDATRLIRQQPWGRDVPIVAMTAAAMEEDRAACLAAGMSDHVSKPIAPAELLGVLGKWVRPGAVRMPAVEASAGHPFEGLPAALPGFDLDGALARMGTDGSRLAGVLWRFARDFRDTGSEMTRLVAGGEIEAAARVAHRVKGTAGTVGATDLEAAAAQLERELKTGAGPVSLPAFVRTLCAALDTIGSRVPRPGAAPEQAAEPFDPAVLAGALGRLARVLDEHDLVPDSLIEEVCGQLARTGAGRAGDALRNEVESFDYARALQTLDTIVHSLDIQVDGRHA